MSLISIDDWRSDKGGLDQLERQYLVIRSKFDRRLKLNTALKFGAVLGIFVSACFIFLGAPLHQFGVGFTLSGMAVAACTVALCYLLSRNIQLDITELLALSKSVSKYAAVDAGNKQRLALYITNVGINNPMEILNQFAFFIAAERVTQDR